MGKLLLHVLLCSLSSCLFRSLSLCFALIFPFVLLQPDLAFLDNLLLLLSKNAVIPSTLVACVAFADKI
jgi:hypothetical protein